MFKSLNFNFRPSRSLSGIILMVVHAIAMSALYVIQKKLLHVLHPAQLTFFYKLSVLLGALPWCFTNGGIRNLKTSRISLHIARSVFSTAASLCFCFALMRVNAADATAITYLEQIIVLCVSIFYFKEKINKAKIILIVCGITGSLFIIRPGFSTFNAYYLYLFAALGFWALNNISIKVLGQTERSRTQLFYATFFGSIISFPIAIQHSWPSLKAIHLGLIVMLGIFHWIQVIAFFKAFKFADMSVVMPLDYMRLIFISIFAYLFLSEIPNPTSFIGYILIILGGMYLIYDEGRKGGWREKNKKSNL